MIEQYKEVPVLVTGANGFIGSHLVRRLVSFGAHVTCLVEPETSLWRLDDIKHKVDICQIDIRDYSSLTNLFRNRPGPKKVFHLAAYIDVGRNLDLMAPMIDVNLLGTVNLIKALQANECQLDCFINTGTCEEYGNNTAPFQEIQKESPVSPYSCVNVCTTYFCQMLYRIAKVPTIILRPFLTYGPYQLSDMLIPSLIKSCLLKEPFLMTKGEQTRDFVFISDIVEGFLLAAISKKAIGQIINLCSSKEYMIKEVVEMITRLTKAEDVPQMGKLPYRSGEAMHFYGTNNKAKELLGWKPKVSLFAGLEETVNWYRRHIHGSQV